MKQTKITRQGITQRWPWSRNANSKDTQGPIPPNRKKNEEGYSDDLIHFEGIYSHGKFMDENMTRTRDFQGNSKEKKEWEQMQINGKFLQPRKEKFRRENSSKKEWRRKIKSRI